MSPLYRALMVIRLLLIIFGIVVLAGWFCAVVSAGYIYPITWLPPSVLSIVAVSILVSLEELYALHKMGCRQYYRKFFHFPESRVLPSAQFEGDRTFVELLAGVSAAIVGIGLPGGSLPNPWPARISFIGALLLSFFFLNIQAASVEADYDERQRHVVRLQEESSGVLLLLRSLIYWAFIYGLAYVVIAEPT